MIELLIDEDEAKIIIQALKAAETLYKEDSKNWKDNKRILGYIEYLKKEKSSSTAG